MPDRAFARQNQQRNEALRRHAVRHLALHRARFRRKLIAGKQRLNPPARDGALRFGRADGVFRRFAAGDGQRLVDMQFTRPAVRADAAIIVDAIGQVGALLHFGHHQPRADGVHRARRNEEAIARLRRNPAQQLGQGVVFNRGAHLRQRRFALKAVIDARALARIEHEPHFALSQRMFEFPRVCVVGVHLHGERPGRVDQLNQQRKRPGVLRLCARVLRVLGEILPERPPGVCAPRDDGRPGLVAAQLPAFRQRGHVRPLAPIALEAVPAPDIILKRGAEQQGASALRVTNV